MPVQHKGSPAHLLPSRREPLRPSCPLPAPLELRVRCETVRMGFAWSPGFVHRACSLPAGLPLVRTGQHVGDWGELRPLAL